MLKKDRLTVNALEIWRKVTLLHDNRTNINEVTMN